MATASPLNRVIARVGFGVFVQRVEISRYDQIELPITIDILDDNRLIGAIWRQAR